MDQFLGAIKGQPGDIEELPGQLRSMTANDPGMAAMPIPVYEPLMKRFGGIRVYLR